MTGSDAARAFRDRMAGLVGEHTAGVRAAEQRWQDTAAAGDGAAREQVDRARKLAQRVRERSAHLQDQQRRGPQEISDYAEDEVDPEVEELSRELLARRAASKPAAPDPAAPDPAASKPAPDPPRRTGAPRPAPDFEDDDFATATWLR